MRQAYYGDFAALAFPKTGGQIVDRATRLKSEVDAMIVERERRIRAAADEAGMKNAGDVLVSLQAIAEGRSGSGDFDMTVGLAAKVRGEISALTNDRAESSRLDLIIRNLPRDRTFDLSFAELTYFRF